MVDIAVESHFEHYSRYNVIVMCGGFDSSAEQLYVVSTQKGEGESITRLKADKAHHIELIIYFVPKSTPQGKNEPIADHPPFEAQVSVKKLSKDIYRMSHTINAWGGAAIKINLEL